MTPVFGAAVSGAGGFLAGSSAWPLKVLRRYRFEHWLFLQILTGLVALPWIITLTAYPGLGSALTHVPPSALWRANLFSIGWGIANVLCVLCFLRIGVALTGGVLGGVGIAVGAVVPMVFRAPGLFQSAPGPSSPAGRMVLCGVAVLLAGVVLASLAGLRREGNAAGARRNGMVSGLALAVLSGVLASCLNFTFAYGQSAILDAVTRVKPASQIRVLYGGQTATATVDAAGMATLTTGKRVHIGGLSAGEAAHSIENATTIGAWRPGAVTVDTQDPLSVCPVWALCVFGGAMVNVLYAAWRIHAGRSWHTLATGIVDAPVAVIGGAQFLLAFVLMGRGSLMMGSLGASAGWGIYSALQILGGQAVGWFWGEWKGAPAPARRLMAGAIALLLVGAGILASAQRA